LKQFIVLTPIPRSPPMVIRRLCLSVALTALVAIGAAESGSAGSTASAQPAGQVRIGPEQPARITGPTDEARTLQMIRSEGARRVTTLSVRLAGVPQGPERLAVEREVHMAKVAVRIQELRAIASFARARGDHETAIRAERAIGMYNRTPKTAPFVQTLDKSEVRP
jgi:hypothetical protein